jgi:transcriptional regulator with XRE-family HTH domain
MTKKAASDGWGAGYCASVSKRVRELRAASGMSAQQVADATAALGFPLARAVISHLELGRRDGIDVREVLVLAAVFGVSPFTILVSPDSDTELPGGTRTPAEAFAWMTGLPQDSELDDAARDLSTAMEAATVAEKAMRAAREALAAIVDRQPAPSTDGIDADDYDDSAGVL